MAECKYEGCKEKVFEDSDYCILHVELPNDENSDEFERINELKEKKVKERIHNKNFNFEGVKLNEFNLEAEINGIDPIINLDSPKIIIENDLILKDAKIKKDLNLFMIDIGRSADFEGIDVGGDVSIVLINANYIHFNGATINNNFYLSADINENLVLYFADINGNLTIMGNINGYLISSGVNIGRKIVLAASIGKDVIFRGSDINGSAYFEKVNMLNLDFSDAIFHNKACFSSVKIEGNVNFDNTQFYKEVDFSSALFMGFGLFSNQKKFNASFLDARLKNIVFRNCNLTKVRFEHAILENCELSSSKLPNKIPEHKDYEKGEKDVKIVADTYRRIRLCLQKEGAFNEAGEFYIKEMNMKRESFKRTNVGMWILYVLLSATSNYGESLRWIVFYFIVLIFAFMDIYSLIFNFIPSDALSFSAINSIALIYNQPSNGLEWVIFAERLIGTFLTAVFIYVFTRKLSR